MAGLLADERKRGILAVLLIALAIVFFVLYAFANRTETHSFNAGHSPPHTVRVTQGKQYEISTPDGVPGLVKRGLDPSAVTCTYQTPGGTSAPLSVSSLGSSTRATHAVATFTAPMTGEIQVQCQPLIRGTFVDDADDGAADPAGLFMLLGTISLGLGVPLGLSWAYARSTRLRGFRVDDASADVGGPSDS